MRKTKFVIAATEKTYANSIGMEFVLIPAGYLAMHQDDHTSYYSISVSTPFYLGKYEVTQAQWEAVMESNPSIFKGPDNPVEYVSWLDVREFIRRLNQKEGHKCYRLPTASEWEYAARAGTSRAWYGKNQLSKYAWDGEDIRTGSTHPVGGKRPNPWGLYDVYGNVSEWGRDGYSKEHKRYDSANASLHSVCGGCWFGKGDSFSHGAFRYERKSYLGFRLALYPE